MNNNNKNEFSDREELLRTFQDSIEEKKVEEVQPYRATTNFNTTLNNPNANIENKMNVNINSDPSINNTMGMSIDSILSAEKKENPVEVPIVPNVEQAQEPIETVDNSDVTERFYKEEPMYDMQTEKTVTYVTNSGLPEKKKSLNIFKDKENMIILLIVLIIGIFILILPVISDLFNKIS